MERNTEKVRDRIENLKNRTSDEVEGDEPGASAVSGEISMEGTDEMLEDVGLSRKDNSAEKPLEKVNNMLFAIGNDGKADRYSSFMAQESPSYGVQNRHEEQGVAEYDGGFQFLTQDGQTLRNAVDRLNEETDLDVGSIAGALTRNSRADKREATIEMYQSIKSGDYETQRKLADEMSINEAIVSRKLSELEEYGLIDREDGLELTEDGYEVSKTLRGLEAYASSK